MEILLVMLRLFPKILVALDLCGNFGTCCGSSYLNFDQNCVQNDIIASF